MVLWLTLASEVVSSDPQPVIAIGESTIAAATSIHKYFFTCCFSFALNLQCLSAGVREFFSKV
jgi:hypothetical protein